MDHISPQQEAINRDAWPLNRPDACTPDPQTGRPDSYRPDDQHKSTAHHPTAKERLHDASLPLAISLAIHAMAGCVIQASDKSINPTKDNLGTVLQDWENQETRNDEAHAQLKEHIRLLVDQWINQYMDHSHMDYLGNRNNPKATIVPAEVYLHIDALREVEQMVKNRRFGDELEFAALLEKVAQLRADRMAIHEEGIKMVIDDTTLTWTCDPLKDFPTYQRVAFIGPRRYFYAKGAPETYYNKNYWPLSDQLLDGAVNCQVARSTAMLIREVYEEKCPDDMEALDGFRTIEWRDHVHSGYEDSKGQIHTLREGALSQPVIQGTQPKGAIDPGKVLPLADHLAVYIEESGFANEAQKERMRALELLPLDLGLYTDSKMPPGFLPFTGYEELMEDDTAAKSSGRSRNQEPEESEPIYKSFKELLTEEGIYYISKSIKKSYPARGGISIAKWPALMSNETFLTAVLKRDGKEIPFWFYTAVDPRLKGKTLLPRLEEWKNSYQAETTGNSRLEEIAAVMLGYGEVEAAFLLDQYAKNPQFAHEWQAAFDVIETYKGRDYYSLLIHHYEDASLYLARHTGDARYAERVYTMTGEENLDSLTVRSIERASDEAINRLADRLIAEAGQINLQFSNENGFDLHRQWTSLLRRLSEDKRYEFLNSAKDCLGPSVSSFWLDAVHKFVLDYPERHDEMVQQVLTKLYGTCCDEIGLSFGPKLEELNLYAKKYPALKTPDGVNVFEKFKEEGMIITSHFEYVYYFWDAEEVQLEKMDDFRRLVKDTTVIITGGYGNRQGVETTVLSTETFQTPNPVLRRKIRELYRKTADPRERLEILGMQPLENAATLFVPIADVYPQDKDLLARYDIATPGWNFGKARIVYAPETISIEEWKVYMTEIIEAGQYTLFRRDLRLMQDLNPQAFEQLIMAAVKDESP